MQIARGATATFHTRCEAMNLAVLLRGSCTRVGYLHSWHAQRSALIRCAALIYQVSCTTAQCVVSDSGVRRPIMYID